MLKNIAKSENIPAMIIIMVVKVKMYSDENVNEDMMGNMTLSARPKLMRKVCVAIFWYISDLDVGFDINTNALRYLICKINDKQHNGPIQFFD
jgi:hypothetical protein